MICIRWNLKITYRLIILFKSLYTVALETPRYCAVISIALRSER